MLKVRLDDYEVEAAIKCFKRHFLEGDKLWLFGSRVDLKKRGGDIDFYIETQFKTYEQVYRARVDFVFDLCEEIGHQRIDVVVKYTDFKLLIHDEARSTGVRLV